MRKLTGALVGASLMLGLLAGPVQATHCDTNRVGDLNEQDTATSAQRFWDGAC